MTVYHDGTWSATDLKRMAKGESIERCSKLYSVCSACHQVIRMDKPLVGSTHMCAEPGSK